MVASARTLRRLTVALLAAFVALLFAAALAYPGALERPPGAPAFDWSKNYWCDLLHESAAGGASNALGAVLAKAGFAALGASLIAFWLMVSRRIGRPRLARFVALGGALSAVATAAVAIVPSDRFPSFHPPVTLFAGGVGFVCAAITIGSGLAGKRSSWFELWCGLSLLVAAAVNIGLYVGAAYLGARASEALPAVQKAATILLLGWMGAALWGADQAQPR